MKYSGASQGILVAIPPFTQRKVILLALLALILTTVVSRITAAQATNCTNLLTNTSLESNSGWNVQSSGSYALFSNHLAHSGTQAAHLAGVNNANDTLATTIQLPADKAALNLSFWWQVVSEEENGDFDGLSVLVADSTGKTLKSLVTLGSANATGNWQQSTLDLSEFAGKSVQLKFWAQTDATLVTDFYIDDVAVTACTAGSGFNVFLPMTSR